MSNIQVIVRCRGRNPQEITAKSPIVVELSNDNFSVTEPYITLNQPIRATSPSLETSQKRTYKFDQIYGSQADQSLVYSQIGHPLLLDFLQGINVTILAYGQTGTGKTYTMSGLNNNNVLDENSDIAGIIPRLLLELFEKLNKLAGDGATTDDYMVKISYLEIYNEELIDLLNNGNGNSRKLRIHEKVVGKSKSINIQNLTEYCIGDYNQGIKYLKMGLQKKKTSSTNLNDSSSRSHTIFSVQLFQKISSDDDSLYRISKMNLVDLAGSENISRSGSVVKEAGGINQSLLTLGRVINSLNEKKLQHIPYRESKLTHILQDSLGGNTKTTLIATISPAQVNFLETCSTLDYASKAKNVKNTPRVGHDSEVIMKKTLVKHLAQELTQMSMDLIATRNKNGVYLDSENYDQLIQENHALKTQAKEDKLAMELLKAKVATLEFTKLENKEEIDLLKQDVQGYKTRLSAIEKKYRQAVSANNDNQVTINALNEKLKRAFEKSSSSANMLVNLLSNHLRSSIGYLSDIKKLHADNDTVQRLTSFESELGKQLSDYKTQVETQVQEYQKSVGDVLNLDLTDYITTFKQNFDHLLIFQQDFYTRTQDVIHEFSIANDKLSGFLKEDYLSDLGTNLNSQLNTLLVNNFSPLVDNFRNLMMKEIEGTIDTVMKDYGAASEKEISRERENAFKIENTWKGQIGDILPRLERELTSNNRIHQDCKAKLQSISRSDEIFKSINQLKEQKVKISNRPDISKLSKISTNIKDCNNKIVTNLDKIDKELSEILLFDANMVKISPIKDTTLSSSQFNKPSLSPSRAVRVHRSAGTSPTRIPSLQRLTSETGDLLSAKRRKILHTLDNVN
ncbi:Kinesin-like protein CIN8 [Candida viswanathii]|uniref:Kinesin-like protein n=1 Tax=Candida viswanathii TaxID=5486 RepID=A0A367Y9T5_9ASCO|nr:Kinesin-like protein CIN8 [Candida viswanathii]